MCVVGVGVGQAGKVEGGVRLDVSPPLSLENEAATLSPSLPLPLSPLPLPVLHVTVFIYHLP